MHKSAAFKIIKVIAHINSYLLHGYTKRSVVPANVKLKTNNWKIYEKKKKPSSTFYRTITTL